MSRPLHVLIVENSDDDALLLVRGLEQGDYEVTTERVDTPEAFSTVLVKQEWNIIIADYNMPRFNGIDALELLEKSGIDIPFIIVSGTNGEKTAVNAMKAGAHDHLIKGCLRRLIPAVEGELRGVEVQRERKRAQGEEWESQRTLLTLMSNLPGMAYRRRNDRDWTMEFVSEQCFDLTGYRPSNLVHNRTVSYGQLIHPDDQEPVWNNMQMALREHRPYQLLYRIKTARRDERWVWEQGCGVFSTEGDLSALEGFITDITDRKQVEEQLKQANAELARRKKLFQTALSDLGESHEKLKAAQLQLMQTEKLVAIGQLASGVAHEVKNPLGIILQGVSYLEGEFPPDDGEKFKVLQMIKEAIRRAEKIISGLLNFSRPATVELKPTAINELIETSLELVQKQLITNGIRVTKDVVPALPSIMADENQIKQVFINLLLNAFQAMPNGGRLGIRCYTKELTERRRGIGGQSRGFFRPGETVVICEVEDTGVGIPRDKLSKVFDPFFTTKPPGQGTGLGLPITRAIVEVHRGTINIESEEGRGTRIILTLPLMKEAVDPA